MTRRPASASSVAAANPATPPPITAASKSSATEDQRAEPDAGGNQRALRTRDANHLAEDVVARRLDAGEDAAIDGSHDLRSHHPPAILGRKRAGGARVVVPGAGRLAG